MRYPPRGYEFTTGGRAWDRVAALPTGSDLIIHNLPVLASKLLPVPLVKAWLESKFARPPSGTSLTYAYNHTVFRQEPWVLNVEWAHMLAGFEVKQLRRFKGVIERLLASPYCRKIVTWCEPARRSILANLDCRGFAHKIDVVPIAVHGKQFTKVHREDRVRILFAGSANAPRGFVSGRLPGAYLYDFYQKGGQEALETYTRLKPRYPRAGAGDARRRPAGGAAPVRFGARHPVSGTGAPLAGDGGGVQGVRHLPVPFASGPALGSDSRRHELRPAGGDH